MSPIVFGMVLPWLLLAFGCWLFYQLFRQNGRILLRLEAMERQLKQLVPAPARRAGLPVGSAAPEFELPDLSGTRHALAQFRGRRVLLIFFGPRCGFCTKMLPDLAALPPDGSDGRPVPLVVTSGDVEANRRLVQEHGVRCPVLIQEKAEVAARYQGQGTPTGYLIDERGAIASELAVGAEALLALAVAPSPAAGNGEGHGPAEGAPGREVRKGKANRGLHTSRLNRSGLKAGTPAPDFRLPRPDGGELSLADYRGRRVLLVFSDPECGPCDQLAPQLERLHRERADLQVLMVSRRDPEANRRKAAELGLTFPVALQKSWEVSLRYGIFATPVGYLIDEQGIIAADVAQGVEPILALAASTTVPDGGRVAAAHDGQEVEPTRA
jgi:peroxiredoxin